MQLNLLFLVSHTGNSFNFTTQTKRLMIKVSSLIEKTQFGWTTQSLSMSHHVSSSLQCISILCATTIFKKGWDTHGKGSHFRHFNNDTAYCPSHSPSPLSNIVNSSAQQHWKWEGKEGKRAKITIILFFFNETVFLLGLMQFWGEYLNYFAPCFAPSSWQLKTKTAVHGCWLLRHLSWLNILYSCSYYGVNKHLHYRLTVYFQNLNFL